MRLKTNLNISSSIRFIDKLANPITKISDKVHNLKIYDKIIDHLIYEKIYCKIIDEKL